MRKKVTVGRFAKAIILMLTIAMVVGLYSPVIKTNAATSNLLNTYGSFIGKSGCAVSYNQLKDATTLNFIKTHFNSITMGNEMKPDFVLNWGYPSFSTVATSKSNGYIIPSSYTDTKVPVINFTKVDDILKICYDNGLKLRGHTLVWHSQTPDWFFREGYSATGAYVSQSVMNARMEMYIKSFMKHVYSSSYGSVVYAWDVVNEYLHATTSGWSAVYGTGLGTTPAYVKQAFQYASDYLTSIGKRSSVSLFYNDYNEYDVTDSIISLINYINSSSKLCDGIGMQSHMSTTYPTVTNYVAALQKFAKTGLEIQITELDVGNTSESEQATYVYNLMKGILAAKKAGGNITCLTWWGVADTDSWRADKKPLLFSTVGTPKASYTQALQAYTDSNVGVVSVKYQTHVQEVGWQDYVSDGAMSGTTGRSLRLEGIKIKIENDANLGVEYTTHVQDIGWQDYVSNDSMSGTLGQSKRLEAIKIRLTGDNASLYDVYYRVHAEDYGWLDWAKNDAPAGTEGLSKRLEGIEIIVVKKTDAVNLNTTRPFVSAYSTASVSYRTHVQDYGWQDYVSDGSMSGTQGQSKRLEGINIIITNNTVGGGITYSTHVQDYGWMDYVSDGAMSGTEGQSKRLEAIMINLTGELANRYDIYYRVHAQEVGWMGWAKNGEAAGTAGFSYRLEGIEIVLVAKGGAAPGSTEGAFIQRT